VQCERREVGLAWGEYCSVCREERSRVANRIARRVAIAGAVLLAAWLIWRTPNQLVPRIFAAASVLLLYVVLRRLVSRLAMDLMPKKPVSKGEQR
jgi:predicted PurR-regulated permease PerM